MQNDEDEDWLEEPADEPDPIDPLHEVHALDVPAEDTVGQRVDFDLYCVRCGYNLRSTLATGSCPECGEPVDTSLRPDLLHMADPPWLGKLRKGMNWLIAGIVMNLLFIPIAMVIGFLAVTYAANQNSNALPTGAAIILGILGLIIAVTYCLASWFVTEPEYGAADNRVSRSLTRWLIPPGMAISIVAELLNANAQSNSITVGTCFDLVSSIMLLVGFLAWMWYLRLLANRIPEPGLARQTMIVFWGILATTSVMIVVFASIAVYAASMASSNSPNSVANVAGVITLLVCPLLLSMLVFGIWWIVLMFRYRTRFTQAYGIALGMSDTPANPGR